MEEVFDMDKLECAFGGRNPIEFNIVEYGQRMKEDDNKMALYWNSAVSVPSSNNTAETKLFLETNVSESGSDSSDKEDVNLDSVDIESGSNGSPKSALQDSSCLDSDPDTSAKLNINSGPVILESSSKSPA